MGSRNDNPAGLPESHPMNGGDGDYSYAKNSKIQMQGRNLVNEMINEAITKKLDVENFSSTKLNIADLGCSVGPNTFISMQNIIEIVQKMYPAQTTPEFQVFFNDHVGNDFNTLFASLPPERPYLAAGVPGSFYGRLFPESSLHFVHSSYAIHWMSNVPKEVMDKDSLAWTKRIAFHPNLGEDSRKAYEVQFHKDMEVFFYSRAKEIVTGGMMVLLLPIVPIETSISEDPFSLSLELLEATLRDMVEEGLIDEEKVDLLKLPIYTPTIVEMRKIVEENGCFSIEIIEQIGYSSQKSAQINSKDVALLLRSVMEGIIIKHFGREIIDGLFDRCECKCREYIHVFNGKSKFQLLLIVKRN